MGDGLPSLAPQWLKSGSSSALGAGTHGISSTKEAGIKSGSWRESGSRLGLGAGAEREAPALDSSKPATSSTRRQSGSYQEHSRGFPGERGSGFRQGNGRIPSDRELVEQTSLKLRPGGREATDSSFQNPGFHGPHPKNGERSYGPRAGQRSGNRKTGSSARNGPIHPRTPERDFGGGARHPAGSLAPHSRLVGAPPLSPRPSIDQPWTARRAEPSTEPDLVPADSAAPLAAASSKPTPKPAQRMADAILQAQASAAQEAEAAKTTKARMEQIALRQSKQLVPVIAGPKSKHANATLSPSSLTPLKKASSGLEPLGRPHLSTLSMLSRKDEDATTAGRRTPPPPGFVQPSGSDVAPNAVSPGVTTTTTKPQRDRLAFFGSLRRKTSGGELTGSGDHSQLVRQGSSNVSETASVVDFVSPKRASSPAEAPDENGTATAPAPESPSGQQSSAEPAESTHVQPRNETSSVEPMSQMTPEEVAFMRSLGWEETSGDDAEGGLTEEEVAGFRAKYPNGVSRASPIAILSQRSFELNSKGTQQSRSFHSELEFSESDTD